MEWLEIFKTGGTGAVFGGIGSIIGEGFAFFRRRQSNKHELELLRLEAELENQRHNQDVETAEIAERIMGNIASHQSYLASVKHDSNLTGVSQGIQDFRAITRPALTWQTWLFLWLLLSVALIWPVQVAAALQIALVGYLVETFIFSGSGFASWWFGERMFSKTRTAP